MIILFCMYIPCPSYNKFYNIQIKIIFKIIILNINTNHFFITNNVLIYAND